jgi:hypothetical protein
LRVCGQHDSDPCLEWACSTGEHRLEGRHHWTINALEVPRVEDQGEFNSLKIDAAGAVHIAYQAGTSKLKYLKLCP